MCLTPIKNIPYHTNGNSTTWLTKALVQGWMLCLPTNSQESLPRLIFQSGMWILLPAMGSHKVALSACFIALLLLWLLEVQITPLLWHPWWKGKISVWRVGRRARKLRKWDRTGTYFQEHTVSCWRHCQEEKLFSLRDCYQWILLSGWGTPRKGHFPCLNTPNELFISFPNRTGKFSHFHLNITGIIWNSSLEAGLAKALLGSNRISVLNNNRKTSAASSLLSLPCSHSSAWSRHHQLWCWWCTKHSHSMFKGFKGTGMVLICTVLV